MEASKAVSKKESTELVAGRSAEELDALAGSIKSKVKKSDIVLPGLRLIQPMSKAAEEQLAKPGEWVNSLTGENYGEEVRFIVAGHFYGVQYVNRDEDFFGSIPGGADTVIPSNWPHPDAGKRFGESDAFEDRFKERLNDPNDDLSEWGDGPDFSVTYNFVGFRAGAPGEVERLGLARTSAPAAKKLLSLATEMDRYPWGHEYIVTTRKVEENGNKYWVAEITRGDAVEGEDLEAIVELALNLHRADEADIVFEGDAPESSGSSGSGKADVVDAEGAIDLD